MAPPRPSPASDTKHHSLLHHPPPLASWTFALQQRSASGETGTTLWLSAQVLAAYLAWVAPSHEGPPTVTASCTGHGESPRRSGRAIELGSGVGYLALCLAALGRDVVGTDIGAAVHLCRANVEDGIRMLRPGSGRVEVMQLDWKTAADSLSSYWPTVLHATSSNAHDDNTTADASQSTGDFQMRSTNELGPPFDAIYTTDTLYSLDLIQPLLRTMANISSVSGNPPITIALERRDPPVINSAFEQAEAMGFNFRQVDPTIVREVVETVWGWAYEDWEGVEIWQGTFGRLPATHGGQTADNER